MTDDIKIFKELHFVYIVKNRKFLCKKKAEKYALGLQNQSLRIKQKEIENGQS